MWRCPVTETNTLPSSGHSPFCTVSVPRITPPVPVPSLVRGDVVWGGGRMQCKGRGSLRLRRSAREVMSVYCDDISTWWKKLFRNILCGYCVGSWPHLCDKLSGKETRQVLVLSVPEVSPLSPQGCLATPELETLLVTAQRGISQTAHWQLHSPHLHHSHTLTLPSPHTSTTPLSLPPAKHQPSRHHTLEERAHPWRREDTVHTNCTSCGRQFFKLT